MRSSYIWMGGLVVVGLIAGCGASASQEAGETREHTADTASALSTTATSYVSIHYNSDYNDYTVRDVNGPQYSYVYDLDWSKSGLNQTDIDKVYAADETEIIFFGNLGAYSASYGERTFVVLEAYLGMPGKKPGAGEVFFKASHRYLDCFAAPCNSETAATLNSASTQAFTSYDVSRAATGFVDQAWLTRRVEFKSAIVAAKFTPGTTYPAGTASLLDASQVFVKLPDAVGPCPAIAQPACPSGQVATFTRSSDRCVIFDRCVTPGVCSFMMPACAAGYTLESWKAAPNACRASACDPTFITH